MEQLEDRTMLSAGVVLGATTRTVSDSFLDSGGKIVLAGAERKPTGSSNGISVQRYNADGTLDSGFGTAGAVTTTFGSGATANGVVAYPPKQTGLPDRILAVGSANVTQPDRYQPLYFALARYNADGSPDDTFNKVVTKKSTTYGTVLTKVGVGNYGAIARSALVQPDGSIVVVGAYAIDAPQQNWRVALARYTPAGKLDATFGGGGIVLMPSLVTGSSQADAVWDQGKILVRGSGNLYRFNTNGTLDATFDQDGIVQTTLSGPLAVDPAGNIFVGGTVSIPQPVGLAWTHFAVAKYLADGRVDTTFGTNGVASGNYGAERDGTSAIGLQPQAGGGFSIIVGGSSQTPDSSSPNGWSQSQFAAARFTAAGVLDSSFGSGGVTITPILYRSNAGPMDIQTDGRIVLAGRAQTAATGGTYYYTVLARYTFDGALDSTFGTSSAPVAPGNAATSAAPLANATLAAVPSAPMASPTFVSNAAAQTAKTNAPSTGRDAKGLQVTKRDDLAVDAAIQDLDADLLADELASVLVP
jgi:uncharacterized delta-60 repeat protein